MVRSFWKIGFGMESRRYLGAGTIERIVSKIKKERTKKGLYYIHTRRVINKWRNLKPFESREIDVSYRTNEYSRLRCSLRNLKCEIGNKFIEKYENLSLRNNFRIDVEAETVK